MFTSSAGIDGYECLYVLQIVDLIILTNAATCVYVYCDRIVHSKPPTNTVKYSLVERNLQITFNRYFFPENKKSANNLVNNDIYLARKYIRVVQL